MPNRPRQLKVLTDLHAERLACRRGRHRRRPCRRLRLLVEAIHRADRGGRGKRTRGPSLQALPGRRGLLRLPADQRSSDQRRGLDGLDPRRPAEGHCRGGSSLGFAFTDASLEVGPRPMQLWRAEQDQSAPSPFLWETHAGPAAEQARITTWSRTRVTTTSCRLATRASPRAIPSLHVPARLRPRSVPPELQSRGGPVLSRHAQIGRLSTQFWRQQRGRRSAEL